MNEANLALAEGLISAKYVRNASEAIRKREGLVKTLLSQRRLPDEGWDDATVEDMLADLASMDSNNFIGNVGLGEREGRVFSGIVRRRHFAMAHGVGRSGDLTAEQPKAAGSSLMSKIAHFLVLHALKVAGLKDASQCLIMPLATGMTITTTLLALRSMRPAARRVVWPRIDQKTCLKAIRSAGLEPIVIENRLEGDELRTDVEAVHKAVSEDPDSVLCVISTTSCFAPRVPERVLEIAQLCMASGVPHLVNNAYGTQDSATMEQLTAACRRGRVDAVIQSTDKNFLVPVGGAVIASVGKEERHTQLVKLVSELYPGRASSAPILDVFITLLSMGRAGYERLLRERDIVFAYTTTAAKHVAASHGERVLITKHNRISMAMTLNSFCRGEEDRKILSNLGGMLFSRSCSGTRVVTCAKQETVAGITFPGYGSHADNYPHPYLAFAIAIGSTKEEVDIFMKRLDATLREMRKKHAGPGAPPAPPLAVRTDTAEEENGWDFGRRGGGQLEGGQSRVACGSRAAQS